MTNAQTIEQQAYALGKEHARNAASWVIDGNTEHETIVRLVAMMDDGDPEVFDWLPREPNLSGEYADDLTPTRLCDELGMDVMGSMEDGAVCDAYEDGVRDTFYVECERILRESL